MKKKEQGLAAVELTLVLPVLFLIIFVIIEFSVALYDKAIITNASREAARAGIVLKSPKLTTAQIQSVANNYLGSNLITFGSSVTPTVTPLGAGGAFGTQLSVQVTYPYSTMVLGGILHVVNNPINLSATTVMLNE
ncbi:TadE/TadG family type IV pilus assembly protein [Pseudomonas sp. 6D_7.1_Bac1]|uniref:TadE/TadG family type IV pilus assembly protein n=1 Tax=Pseudomonas sp. 6D_7.1_Bac1 TaxID=2971615 RepID=UPI0021C6CF5A|nr:TadE/TadG family type IV pilus assembly protein [Pseudomonas sp. 6D_7.1_Bac1]MCU1752103.1 pilus assembly protein [Pseudomonas sp. 6D_7.1_Bac1]